VVELQRGHLGSERSGVCAAAVAESAGEEEWAEGVGEGGGSVVFVACSLRPAHV
jgi:hypothetical protein